MTEVEYEIKKAEIEIYSRIRELDEDLSSRIDHVAMLTWFGMFAFGAIVGGILCSLFK